MELLDVSHGLGRTKNGVLHEKASEETCWNAAAGQLFALLCCSPYMMFMIAAFSKSCVCEILDQQEVVASGEAALRWRSSLVRVYTAV